MTWDYQRIQCNIAEAKRQFGLTTYQRVNERAADHKADAWLTCTPLTKKQLKDDFQGDEQLTVDVGVFGQFVVLKRPTENRAIEHTGQRWMDRLKVHRREPAPERWCIECKQRHAPRAFLRSPKYLHGLSYACKMQLKALRRRPWRHAPAA